MRNKIYQEKKNGIQKELFPNSNNNTTNNTTSATFERRQRLAEINGLPENGWLVLAQFANLKETAFNYVMDQVTDVPATLSKNEIAKIVKSQMHSNTVADMIWRLLQKKFIRVAAKNTGKTRRETRYVVTPAGQIAWNLYSDR